MVDVIGMVMGLGLQCAVTSSTVMNAMLFTLARGIVPQFTKQQPATYVMFSRGGKCLFTI